MGRTPFRELFAVKLARYHAAKKKAKGRRIYRQRKRREKARLEEALRLAREALGWKGGKPSPKHIAALHAGRDRHHQAQREKKLLNTGRS